MPQSGVRPLRRRASFSIRFGLILGLLGVLIAGATAAIPLELAATETRNVALDRAGNKAGVAANLVQGQRQTLHAFVGGVAGAIAGPLSTGDSAAATQVLVRESLVTAPDDLVGATVDPTHPVLRQGSALPEGDGTRVAILSGVDLKRAWVLDDKGTPWLLEYVPVPSSLPAVTAFVARPMDRVFVSRLAANLGSGSDAAQLAVVHDGVLGSDTTLGDVAMRQGQAVPDALHPALAAPGSTPSIADVGGRNVAAASASLGAGLAVLVTTTVGPTSGFLSSVIGPVAIIAAVMILLALIVVFTMVQRDLQRPLRRLDRAVAGLAREEFDVPIPAGGDDELGRLATTFEQMRRTLRATLSGAEARAAIAQELNAAQPLQSALQNVCELLRATTDAQSAVFVLAHSEMADAFVSAVGLEREVEPERLLHGGALAGAMDLDGTVPMQCVALPGSAEAEAGMREICAAPLRIGSHAFGVVALADKALGFNAADLALVSSVAEQTALALERYRILAVVQRQASTDELTSLYNYRFLVDYLDQQIALAERLTSPLAVLMLDLDRFKSLNDSLGHHAGDEALRAFARTLRASIRRSDLAARYGGEEFVVVMANTNGEEARLVAEKIRRAVGDMDLQLGVEPTPVRITVSIGGVAYPDDTGDARQLLRLADDALYRAKRTGRDRVCFVGDSPRRRTLARSPSGNGDQSDEDTDERAPADRSAQ